VIVQRGMESIAVVLGVAALALIFAPELGLARFAVEPTAGALVLAQLYGAALFGLAITSWFARTMLLGGIYGRSIVVGGFAHALVGVLALFHALRASVGNAFLWGAFVVYAALAIWFGTLMFGRGPASPPDGTATEGTSA
jgi:hypothetical protein